MTFQEHKKHADLARPAYGHFGRHEWAIAGAPCDAIKALAGAVLGALAPAYKGAYVDSAHPRGGEDTTPPGRLAAGAVWEYTHRIDYQQVNQLSAFNAFQFRQLFGSADIVLVNGNHYAAKAQVVVMDYAKKASLQKHVPQLTNVQLLLLGDDEEEVFDFIKAAVPGWQQLPLYRVDETDKIIAFFKTQLAQSVAPLHGLVLAGGKSLRMGGNDKGQTQWHGKEQRYYTAGLLKDYCREVYISCRADQQQEIAASWPALPDSFTGLGPFGAILSAFRAQPDAAWLVLACDLPLLNRAALDFLVGHRNPSEMATTFASPHDGLPEPLVTIWEPKSYPVLLSLLSQGYSCPRKALINFDVALLEAPDPDVLLNVNTPADAEKAKGLLKPR